MRARYEPSGSVGSAFPVLLGAGAVAGVVGKYDRIFVPTPLQKSTWEYYDRGRHETQFRDARSGEAGEDWWDRWIVVTADEDSAARQGLVASGWPKDWSSRHEWRSFPPWSRNAVRIDVFTFPGVPPPGGGGR